METKNQPFNVVDQFIEERIYTTPNTNRNRSDALKWAFLCYGAGYEWTEDGVIVLKHAEPVEKRWAEMETRLRALVTEAEAARDGVLSVVADAVDKLDEAMREYAVQVAAQVVNSNVTEAETHYNQMIQIHNEAAERAQIGGQTIEFSPKVASVEYSPLFNIPENAHPDFVAVIPEVLALLDNYTEILTDVETNEYMESEDKKFWGQVQVLRERYGVA